MFGLAYVLIPRTFASLQAELDRTLAPFKRGGEDDFPRDKLAFDDVTDALTDMHRAKFSYDADSGFVWSHRIGSFDLRTPELGDHLRARGLEQFDGTFAEIEPDLDTFVRRYIRHARWEPQTGRYGHWFNPLGMWDWWDLGGCFNGAITGERRPVGADQPISSGPSPGRAAMETLGTALGASEGDEAAQIEANVELVETLRVVRRKGRRGLPTAVVLPTGCCAVKDRWFDRVDWHDISPGTRAFLSASSDEDFDTLARAAYEQFSDHAAAGVAYHF